MKELEDYDWFPPVLRKFQLEFIGFVVAKFNLYQAFIRYLKVKALTELSMTDLCSGSGEPAITIFQKSNVFTRLTLSDKYPNTLISKDVRISYDIESVDVLEVQFERGTCYTMFNAFHHFSSEEKMNIVRKIHKAGSSAFIVEILEPTFLCLMKVFFMTTIGSLLFTPFVSPFSFKRLFFTYILPVNILTVTVDGLLSVFKSYSAQKYQRMFSGSDGSVSIIQLKSFVNNIIVIQIDPLP